MARFLSKTKYLHGLQCHKLLWFHYNEPGEIPASDQAKQAIFDAGHQVGELAKCRYPDGMGVSDSDDLSQKTSETEELLPERKPLFEASFLASRCYCQVDVLVPADNDKWDIVEVKSTTLTCPH